MPPVLVAVVPATAELPPELLLPIGVVPPVSRVVPPELLVPPVRFELPPEDPVEPPVTVPPLPRPAEPALDDGEVVEAPPAALDVELLPPLAPP